MTSTPTPPPAVLLFYHFSNLFEIHSRHLTASTRTESLLPLLTHGYRIFILQSAQVVAANHGRLHQHLVPIDGWVFAIAGLYLYQHARQYPDERAPGSCEGNEQDDRAWYACSSVIGMSVREGLGKSYPTKDLINSPPTFTAMMSNFVAVKSTLISIIEN